MDENGAQESHMDFYAQLDSLKALEKKFLKSNHQFFLAVQSPAGQVSLIAESGLWFMTIKLTIKIHMRFLGTIFIHFTL